MATYNTSAIALKVQVKIVREIQKEMDRLQLQISRNEEILNAGFKMTQLTTDMLQLATITEQEQFIQKHQKEYNRLAKLDGKIKNLEQRLEQQMETVNLKVELNKWRKELCKQETALKNLNGATA